MAIFRLLCYHENEDCQIYEKEGILLKQKCMMLLSLLLVLVLSAGRHLLGEKCEERGEGCGCAAAGDAFEGAAGEWALRQVRVPL